METTLEHLPYMCEVWFSSPKTVTESGKTVQRTGAHISYLEDSSFILLLFRGYILLCLSGLVTESRLQLTPEEEKGADW